jgi:hypothetical protein
MQSPQFPTVQECGTRRTAAGSWLTAACAKDVFDRFANPAQRPLTCD